MNKKIVKFLTVLLLLVLTIPTFAAGANTATTKINTRCKLPEIIVTVPATGAILINPYRIPVNMAGQAVDDQIICEPTVLENGSEVPLQVDVSVTATVSRYGLYLTDSSTVGSDSTGKDAFLYFEMKATNNPDSVSWDSGYDPDKHLLVETYGASKENIATLAAKGQQGCYGAFRLSGDCIAKPDVPWSSRDYVNVKVAFTFKALPISS